MIDDAVAAHPTAAANHLSSPHPAAQRAADPAAAAQQRRNVWTKLNNKKTNVDR